MGVRTEKNYLGRNIDLEGFSAVLRLGTQPNITSYR